MASNGYTAHPLIYVLLSRTALVLEDLQNLKIYYLILSEKNVLTPMPANAVLLAFQDRQFCLPPPLGEERSKLSPFENSWSKEFRKCLDWLREVSSSWSSSSLEPQLWCQCWIREAKMTHEHLNAVIPNYEISSYLDNVTYTRSRNL